MAGPLFDDVLNDDHLHIWRHAPGEGKTTTAALVAAERNIRYVLYFDEHKKAREHITNPDTPGAPDAGEDVYTHVKGAPQPFCDCCMDATVRVGPYDTPECPEHGHPSWWDRICPVYELDTDHPARVAYEMIVEERTPNQAHILLGLDAPNEFPWHDEGCPWHTQFDGIKHEDRIDAVHQYATLRSINQNRTNIIDESVTGLTSDRRLTVDGLDDFAKALKGVAETQSRGRAERYTLQGLAQFAKRIYDLIMGEGDAETLADLSAPRVIWDAYETYDAAAGNMAAKEGPEEDWHYAEALAKTKVAYGETIHRRMHKDTWEGEPLAVDVLLAAAIEAGLPADPVRKAIAVPSILEGCPWYHADIEFVNGARCCSAYQWDERENTITKRDGETTRTLAWIDTDTDDVPVALSYRNLSLTSELPDPASTLALDATASVNKVAGLFEVPREEICVSGDDQPEMPNARITQLHTGQYHKGSIEQALDEDRALAARLQDTIDTAGAIHRKALIIVHQDLKPRFDYPDNAEVVYHHGNRELNYDDCDAVVCIGAPHPNMEELRRDAELLAMGDANDLRVGGEEHSTRRGAPNPPVYRKLIYEDADGNGRAVPTKHYTGLVGELFREAREREIEQGVHRVRPATADEPKSIYLITNVPTDLPIDEIATFEEFADPLRAMVPVPERALTLLEHVRDVSEGEGPDGFRASELVEQRDDGTVANKTKGYHRLARACGLTVSERMVYKWVEALESVGLLCPEAYEQQAGVSYTADPVTLQSALSVLSGNGGFKVAAVRRFRDLVEGRTGRCCGWRGLAMYSACMGSHQMVRTGGCHPPADG